MKWEQFLKKNTLIKKARKVFILEIINDDTFNTSHEKIVRHDRDIQQKTHNTNFSILILPYYLLLSLNYCS